jgi:hypothetical protein
MLSLLFFGLKIMSILVGVAKQQEVFYLIKNYLSLAPVLKAQKSRVPFRLYIAAKDKVSGDVLTQEVEGKEHVVTYLSRRLVDVETRYTFVEKLCLCLLYACTKLRCYLLSSPCSISCQIDVINYMLQNPIMSGRIGKWAYALIEYDLAYESLKSMKGHVVVDFIVKHRIDDTHELDVSYLTIIHGSCILMDRFAMKDKGLASCLFHQGMPLLTSLSD